MIMIDTEKRSSEIHFPVAGLIADRRSTRAFSSEPVGADAIESLFEAVRWAPSSSNEQPWYYCYATSDQHIFKHMVDALNPANQAWAANAPLLILSLARKTHLRSGKQNAYSWYDTGGANALLALQAVHLGMQVRQMGGFDRAKAVSALHIPDDLEPVVFIAVGYAGGLEKLPEPLQLKETSARERFLQEAFVRNGGF